MRDATLPDPALSSSPAPHGGSSKKRLRIAVLSRNFSTTGGGAERYSIAVVEGLARQHEVHVFAQTIAHAFPGVVYHRIALPMRKPRWINQLYFAWATWRLTRTGFDVVHAHENTWHGNVHTVHVLPIKHNLFNGLHGIAWALRWLRVLSSPRLLAYLWLEKRRYAFAYKKRIVCASSALKAIVQAAYPKTAPMLSVITPGITPELIQSDGAMTQDQRNALRQAARQQLPLHVPATTTLLLLVGNDFVKKGLPTMLAALAQLPTQFHLAVVGQSEHLLAMQRLAEQTGVAARVHFLGSLSHIDVAYRAADMLVHPTREDSYGMVVLEAMAHGLPVVVSAAPFCGIAEDLTDAVNAVLLQDPTDAPALAAAVQRIHSQPDLAQHMPAQAVAFARHHTWQQAAEAYEALYQGLAHRYTQRWLVLAHAFNMDGRAASQTITDKLPHLEAAGIELVVLSGVSGRKDTHYAHYPLWPAGPAGIRFELRHVLRQRLSSPRVYRLVMVLLSLPLLPFMVLEKLWRPVESSWSWWLSAYARGRWLARAQKFDLIYSTGGAFAAHIAGCALKRALGVRWLAEVHDPLVMPGSKPGNAQTRMQAEVERLICTEADAAIWFTEQALASAKQRHPQLQARGHAVLPGIDAPFQTLPPYQSSTKLRIGHFGALSATRNLLPIVGALELLQKTQPDIAADIELHVYGGPLDAVSKNYVETSSARAHVRHFGRIEADPLSGTSGRERILQLMRSMDVLLLLHGNEAICAEYIPSKMYEYLWMQRPIVAVVHRNPQMAHLLSNEGHCVILDTGGKEDTHHISQLLATALIALHHRWKNQQLQDTMRTSPYTTAATVQNLLAALRPPSRNM